MLAPRVVIAMPHYANVTAQHAIAAPAIRSQLNAMPLQLPQFDRNLTQCHCSPYNAIAAAFSVAQVSQQVVMGTLSKTTLTEIASCPVQIPAVASP